MKYSYAEVTRKKVIEYFGEYPLAINGHEIPIPRVQDYDCTLSPQDSEKSTRAIMKGIKLHRDILGILTKVTISYKRLDASKLNEILGYANYYNTNVESFSFKYFDTNKNAVLTRNFYISDINSKLVDFGKKPLVDVTLTMVSIMGDV